MFTPGIDNYVKQYITNPVYSEFYTTHAVVSGANLVATKTFKNQKIRMILMYTMLLSLPVVQNNNYLFQDQWNRIILQVTTPGTIFGSLDIVRFFISDTITVTTPNAAGLNFSLVYQTIKEDND